MQKTEAPEELSGTDFDAIVAFCQLNFPWWLRDLENLVGSCLDHHGAKGTRFRNWRRACQNWVRNHDRFHPEVGRAWKARQRKEVEEAEFRAQFVTDQAQEQLAFEIQTRKHGGPLGPMLNEILKHKPN